MPYKPHERQYRAFTTMQPMQTTADKKAYQVEGYATTFDVPYEFTKDLDGNTIYEQVLSTALVGADLTDVIFQLNHEGQTLAKQKNNTLELSLDSHGLHVVADLSGSQAGRDLYEAISNGLIDRMSWGFTIAKDGWEYDEHTRVSTITKVDKVFDVSAVSIPADKDTEIHARSYLDGAIETAHKELVERKRQAVELEKLRLLLSI